MSLFNLIFRIGADKTDFNRKMKEVPQDAKRAAREMEGAFSSGLAGRLNGLFGAAAIGAGVREIIRFGGEVKDIAERLQTSTESVQSLMLAAKLGGGDIGDVATSFDRLAKAMEAARGGDKGMARTLEALGATAQDLASMNVDKVFRTIADSIEDLAGNSQSSVQLMEVFGRSGTKLIPIMKELAQIEREPFIKPENVALLDDMGDAITRFAHKAKVLAGTGLARFFKFWLPALGDPTGGATRPSDPGARAALPGRDREADNHTKQQEEILNLEKEAADIAERTRVKRLTAAERENELLADRLQLQEQLRLADKLGDPLLKAGVNKRMAEIDAELFDIGSRRDRTARRGERRQNDSLLSVGNFLGGVPDRSQFQLQQIHQTLRQLLETTKSGNNKVVRFQ